ncbi:MAG: hypothetical protein H6811_06055 [Phycisphaeraceae bacterium]|nr:hypothetical protein [Phycisphaeraceae bacterium]
MAYRPSVVLMSVAWLMMIVSWLTPGDPERSVIAFLLGMNLSLPVLFIERPFLETMLAGSHVAIMFAWCIGTLMLFSRSRRMAMVWCASVIGASLVGILLIGLLVQPGFFRSIRWGYYMWVAAAVLGLLAMAVDALLGEDEVIDA